MQKASKDRLIVLLGGSSELIQEMKFVARHSRSKAGKPYSIADAKDLNERAVLCMEDLHSPDT